MNESVIMLKQFFVASLFLLTTHCCAEDTVEPSHAKQDGYDRAFTCSIITASEDIARVLQRIQSEVVPAMNKRGATMYSIWTPPATPIDQLPERGNFTKGLVKTQFCLMLAWPKEALTGKDLDAVLNSVKGVKSAETRTYVPIYLVQTDDGFDVPTGKGFYTHREARYHSKDVDEVVQLSRDAWKIYDPLYGTKVIGLFRERTEDQEVATLLRIVWYPELANWRKSREVSDKRPMVREVRAIFRKRSSLQLEPGPGPAWASDRFVP